jgi:hypothetical protein
MLLFSPCGCNLVLLVRLAGLYWRRLAEFGIDAIDVFVLKAVFLTCN